MKKHNECKKFCQIDVAKGICRVSGDIINIDTNICVNFSEIPMCKNCLNFKDEKQDGIGNCVGYKEENWTYASLKAINCESYYKKE